MTAPASPSPLRVGLHVGQLLQRIPGGIGRYTRILASRLGDEPVTVVPFAAGPRPDALVDLAGVDGYVDLGWPRGSLRYELWHRARRPHVAIGVDVVHAPSLAVPPTGRTPLVVTVHDLAFLRLPHYFTIRGLRFHESGLRCARESAAAVIVPSEFVAGELVAEGFAANRVHVAHHGIDPPAAVPDDAIDATLERLGLARPFVLFVGTLEPRKGLGALIDGHRILRRTHAEATLALVGPRGWGKLPPLDRPGVSKLGAITDADLDALYRAASVLAYPSEYEGFGLPVLEAMARGCPVVTSSATSLPEVVGDAGRLVDPHDPEALAAALAEVLEDPALASRMASAGRVRAEAFTWDASIRAHVTAYAAALEEAA